MKEFLDVTFLALLQGVAEFLPISSSGHLVLAQEMLGVNAPGMRLDVFLHVGTVLAIFAYYRRTAGGLLSGCVTRDAAKRRAAVRYALKIVLSALPAILFYFPCKRFLEGLFENPTAVGGCLVFTGLVLTSTRFLKGGTHEVGFLRALAMGVGQALALLPGVSRSGMTLVASRMVRVAPEKAAEFSFLMSVPLILGAAFLELVKGETAAAGEPGWLLVAWGAAVAAVTGYFALAALVRTLRSRFFWSFGPYCILVGLLALLFM